MPESVSPAAPAAGNAAVRIAPSGPRAWLRLKSWRQDTAHGAAPVLLAGPALPVQAGEITAADDWRALCLAPGDWLLEPRAGAAGGWRPRLAEQDLAVVDLGDGLATLEVGGPAARELLAKGCGLDLHPRAFPPGRCARTRFARIATVIECLDGPERFALTVARSQRHYLHDWLLDAAVEFAEGPVA